MSTSALLLTLKKISISIPEISYEKGSTKISFSLPFLRSELLFSSLLLIKKHLANVRIHSFEDGYYSFQAMNKNLFNSENMLDNFKIEFFVLSTISKAEISKKGNLSQEETNLIIELFKKMTSKFSFLHSYSCRLLGTICIFSRFIF